MNELYAALGLVIVYAISGAVCYSWGKARNENALKQAVRDAAQHAREKLALMAAFRRQSRDLFAIIDAGTEPDPAMRHRMLLGGLDPSAVARGQDPSDLTDAEVLDLHRRHGDLADHPHGS